MSRDGISFTYHNKNNGYFFSHLLPEKLQLGRNFFLKKNKGTYVPPFIREVRMLISFLIFNCIKCTELTNIGRKIYKTSPNYKAYAAKYFEL